MRSNEPLRVAATGVVEVLRAQGAKLQGKRALNKVAVAVWRRHQTLQRYGFAKLTARLWRDVSPSWKGRYRKVAREALASSNAGAQTAPQPVL